MPEYRVLSCERCFRETMATLDHDGAVTSTTEAGWVTGDVDLCPEHARLAAELDADADLQADLARDAAVT